MSKIIGDPVQDAGFFPGQQSYPDTCAIRCQEMILEEFTGLDIPEEALVQTAQQHGWYAPGGGTSPADVGNLLELNGIPVTRYEDATIMNLSAELAQGHKVIIGVDSGDLWGEDTDIGQEIQELLGAQTADHAVVVTGIDTRDPENVRVLLSDPGTGQAVASYPVDQFMEAWQGSDFFMVATQQPAPSSALGMEHFPYDVGHVDQFGSWSYEELEAMNSENVQDVDVLADGDGSDTLSDMLNAAMEEIDASGSQEEIFIEMDENATDEAETGGVVDGIMAEIDSALTQSVGGAMQQLSSSNPVFSLIQEIENGMSPAPDEGTAFDGTDQLALDSTQNLQQDTSISDNILSGPDHHTEFDTDE